MVPPHDNSPQTTTDISKKRRPKHEHENMTTKVTTIENKKNMARECLLSFLSISVYFYPPFLFLIIFPYFFFSFCDIEKGNRRK
jgi:hypothetical protein